MFTTDLTVRRIIGTKNTWQLKEPLVWQDNAQQIAVPDGFIFNFASIPRFFQNILPREGQNYDRASCLHDWLYTVQELSRADSDLLFLAAMKADKVSRFKYTVIYYAVKWFGGKAWQRISPADRDKMRRYAQQQLRDETLPPDTSSV